MNGEDAMAVPPVGEVNLRRQPKPEPSMRGRAGLVLCFTHIQKAGGTSVEALMRRHFGMAHMLVDPRRGWTYQTADLRADLRLNPWVRSICSHWLRPFVNFGALDERLCWYTMLREPISRYLSHYQHHVEKMGSTRSFEEFLREPIQRNWQTRLIAGEPDLEAAKQLLAMRFRVVGVLERFRESLLLFRGSLGLAGLRLYDGKRHNTAVSSRTREEIHAVADRYRDDCIEHNALDLELYEFVVQELFPRQVAHHGEERLRQELTTEFLPVEATLGERLRTASYLAFRRAVHMPSMRIRTRIARAQGIPDIRR